jgi:ABC-type ATPase involved in cell division
LNSREKIIEMMAVALATDTGFSILRDFNFTLFPGETAVITGSAGTGKTFLSELIIGRQKPQAGSIIVFGQNMVSGTERQKAAVRRRIGGIGGIFDLLPFDSVGTNLLYPLILRGESRSACRTKLNQILAQFNITVRKSHRVTALTRSEKVKVLLARAIIADQPLLLIDEPLDRLGAAAAEEINSILKRLSVSGYTMLLLTTGQTALAIPGAQEYRLHEGTLT